MRTVLLKPLTAMLFMFFLFSCGGDSDGINNPSDFVVSIPDPELEDAIRSEIGRPTGDIYRSDLMTIISLDASGRGISNLTGLSHCKNLTASLNLNNNDIASILPLSGVVNVTELYIRSNNIEIINSLGPLQDIEKIDLDSNQIEEFSGLSGMLNMKELSINANSIAEINAVAVMLDLEILLFADNDVDDLTPLKSLAMLRLIDLSNNNVIDLGPLVENSNLGSGVEIRVTGNPLSQNALDNQIPGLQARGVKVIN